MNRQVWKAKRNKAIKAMKAAGFTELEIQNEIAKLRAELGTETTNLPAVIEKSTGGDSQDVETGSGSPLGPHQTKPNRTADNRSTIPGNVNEWNAHLDRNAERRCAATNARGEPCRKYAIDGSTVCKNHGGATRHVVNKARIRIEMASNRLVGKLIDIAFDDTKPAAVQLDAIKDSLNRAGVVKPAQVEVGPIKPFEQVFSDIVSGPRYPVGPQGDSHDTEDIAGSTQDDSNDMPDSPPFTPVLRESHLGNQTTKQTGQPKQREQPRQTDQPEPKPRDYSMRSGNRPNSRHITGDDAIAVANRTNIQVGALKALPPGRTR